VPRTTVLLYKEADGAVPGKQWLEELKQTDRRGFAKCVERRKIMARKGETRDAVRIIDRMVGVDTELRALIDEERAGADVAQLIHDARARAGLTQRELAELIGTSQPTIARLEDAEYAGHSLGMLRRIAAALHLRLELRLVPDHEAA